LFWSWRTEKAEKRLLGRSITRAAQQNSCSVADRRDMKAFIHFARDKFGRVDVIFNTLQVSYLYPNECPEEKLRDRTAMIISINGVLNGITGGSTDQHGRRKAAVSLSMMLPLM